MQPYRRQWNRITSLAGMILLAVSTAARAETPGSQTKPTLHVLAIGLSEYQVEKLKKGVTFAAKDAKDTAEALKAQQGGMYDKVEVETLLNAKATKKAIEKALDQLAQRVKPGDRVVVYAAGHGDSFLGSWYFLPFDYDPSNQEQTVVAGATFQAKLNQLRVPVLFVLDCCRSGAAGGNSFVLPVVDKASSPSCVITIAACMPGELSHEDSSWSNGAFTKALVEGFKGKADLDKNGVVTLAELDAYVSVRTEQLIEEHNRGLAKEDRITQRPNCTRPQAVPSSLVLTRVAVPPASKTSTSGVLELSGAKSR